VKKLFPLLAAPLLVVLSTCLLTCGGHSPTPVQVTNAIITCTETICTAKATSPECAQLEGAVLGCITSGGNLAVCLAGIPALVGVGYADVVCIVAALATPPAAGTKYAAMATSDVQTKASDWLKTQRISIKQ